MITTLYANLRVLREKESYNLKLKNAILILFVPTTLL